MSKFIDFVKNTEPVAVTTLVSAVFTLFMSIHNGGLDDGIINAVIIALMGLVARSQVSPVGKKEE